MAKKNMIIAMILSIIWSGLGLIYAGDMKKGIIFALYGKSNIWIVRIYCLDLFLICNIQTSQSGKW